jgi:hypothetical protein
METRSWCRICRLLVPFFLLVQLAAGDALSATSSSSSSSSLQ